MLEDSWDVDQDELVSQGLFHMYLWGKFDKFTIVDWEPELNDTTELFSVITGS